MSSEPCSTFPHLLTIHLIDYLSAKVITSTFGSFVNSRVRIVDKPNLKAFKCLMICESLSRIQELRSEWMSDNGPSIISLTRCYYSLLILINTVIVNISFITSMILGLTFYIFTSCKKKSNNKTKQFFFSDHYFLACT